MGTEREIDALAADAIASSEKELFSDTMGHVEVEAEGEGDRSLETMGDGLEGQHEPDGEGDEEQDEEHEPIKAEAEDGKNGRSRDEQGKFKPQGDDKSNTRETPAERGLRTELMSERDKRKAVEAEAARYREEMDRRFAALESRLNQAPPAQQPQPNQQQAQEEIPDRWTDPEGYDRYREAQILKTFEQREAQREQQRLNWSFQEAHAKHGEAFAEAYKTVNALPSEHPVAKQIVQQLRLSPNPGATLLDWHQRIKAQSEIGSDPAAYRERLKNETREALLKDPEIRKQILAEIQKEARSGADGGPRTTTRLPPSLSSARGGSLMQAAAGNGSDAEIFSDIMR